MAHTHHDIDQKASRKYVVVGCCPSKWHGPNWCHLHHKCTFNCLKAFEHLAMAPRLRLQAKEPDLLSIEDPKKEKKSIIFTILCHETSAWDLRFRDTLSFECSKPVGRCPWRQLLWLWQKRCYFYFGGLFSKAYSNRSRPQPLLLQNPISSSRDLMEHFWRGVESILQCATANELRKFPPLCLSWSPSTQARIAASRLSLQQLCCLPVWPLTSFHKRDKPWPF